MDKPAQTLGLGSPVGDEIAIRVRCVYPSPVTDGNIGHGKKFDIYNKAESKIGVGSGNSFTFPFIEDIRETFYLGSSECGRCGRGTAEWKRI